MSGLGEFLDQPVERAARLVAIDLLRQAAAARERLIDPADVEALHDFRVAMRRLRTWLRAYRPHLGGSVRKRERRRLKRVTCATGAARDTEVQLAWLAERESTLDVAERFGATHLRHRLERKKHEATAGMHTAISRHFARAAGELAVALPVYYIPARVDEPLRTTPMAAAAAEVVHRSTALLRDRLRRVRSVDDQELAHDARIEGKRLRYVLEPIADWVEGAPEIIRQLKRLQDVIGELHDACVLSREVLRDAESSSPTDVARPGIVALAAALRARELAAFAELQSAWLDGSDHARQFLDALGLLAAHLGSRATADREIERKYLLHALPDRVHDAPVRHIEQGYVPGTRLAERLRRVHCDGDITCYRTMKLGTGASRTEVEEEAAPDVFDAMWPLTAGHRVHKRRYAITEGDRIWEIDEYTDRELVVAEVELPDVDTPVAPPEWLAPYVVREVTGDPAYLNINLAG